MKTDARLFLVLMFVTVISACGDGSEKNSRGGVEDTALLELIDPSPGVEDRFGSIVAALANGNIVVGDPFDASVASRSGAVHLYSPLSSTPLASIYGERADDQLGHNGIWALTNGNYLILSSSGSLKLMDGDTGLQIASDLHGLLEEVDIIVLDNNNYLVKSERSFPINSFEVSGSGSQPVSEEGVALNPGTVRLMDGDTGVQIGSTVTIDVEDGYTGIARIAALGNNNYVIASPGDSVAGIARAGSVRLMDGTTGSQIGLALAGEREGDLLGSRGITALGNNNYVIVSAHLEDTIASVGSVRLVNGNTGEQIGATLAGDMAYDTLGSGGITVLDNNNYVIVSPVDDVGGIADAGSVRLIDGTTGVQIGPTLAGGETNEWLGRSGSIFKRVAALSNNNYVVASDHSSEDGIVNSGSVRLMNGYTGLQIGATLAGDVRPDQLASHGITVLHNSNYVVTSAFDNEGGTVDAGSVRLMDGSTGVQIGETLAGEKRGDLLGFGRTIALENGNYVIASRHDDENGIVDAGSVRLVDGETGLQIGATLAGDVANDGLGSGLVIALNNSHYATTAQGDEEGGIVNAGSVRLVDGYSGAAIGAAIVGAAEGDMRGVDVIRPVSGDYYILSQPLADSEGLTNAGRVRVVDYSQSP